MEITLKENERIDDLERNGYRIIQNRKGFCFGMDAVLLSGFVCEGETGAAWKNAGSGTDASPSGVCGNMRIADLGTGTGIIPILLHGRLFADGHHTAHEGCPEPFAQVRKQAAYARSITGLEIQEDMKEMAERSVLLNHLEQEIRIVQGDIKEASRLLGRDCYDVVTSNPPYMKRGGGIVNPDSSRAIARHEILCTFADVAGQAAELLKKDGRFYLVHRPERLAELLSTLKQCRLEPKRLRMVHSFADSEASMVLIESVKGGRPFLKVEKPLVIYRTKGQYSDEIRQIYGY